MGGNNFHLLFSVSPHIVCRFTMFSRVLQRSHNAIRRSSTEAKIKGTGKEGEVTQMDLLKFRGQQKTQNSRETTFGGQTVKWNYRSELVNRHGMDNNHRYTWIAIGVSIIFGFTSFVAVKTNVMENRRQAMAEREDMRRSLHLIGEDRKKIGVV